MHSCITVWKDCSPLFGVLSTHDSTVYNYTMFIIVLPTLVCSMCSMCSISVQEMVFCSHAEPAACYSHSVIHMC